MKGGMASNLWARIGLDGVGVWEIQNGECRFWRPASTEYTDFQTLAAAGVHIALLRGVAELLQLVCEVSAGSRLESQEEERTE